MARLLRLLLIITLLVIPINAFAQSPLYGNAYNSKTGKKDMCIRIRSEDGTTIDSKKCKEIRIPDGYLEETDGFFLIGVGKCTAVTKTADYTITTSDCLVLCDASGRDVRLTLPTLKTACNGANCRILDIKKIDDTGNLCIVDGNGRETIDDGLVAELASQYESIKLQGSSASSKDWWIK